MNKISIKTTFTLTAVPGQLIYTFSAANIHYTAYNSPTNVLVKRIELGLEKTAGATALFIQAWSISLDMLLLGAGANPSDGNMNINILGANKVTAGPAVDQWSVIFRDTMPYRDFTEGMNFGGYNLNGTAMTLLLSSAIAADSSLDLWITIYYD